MALLDSSILSVLAFITDGFEMYCCEFRVYNFFSFLIVFIKFFVCFLNYFVATFVQIGAFNIFVQLTFNRPSTVWALQPPCSVSNLITNNVPNSSK